MAIGEWGGSGSVTDRKDKDNDAAAQRIVLVTGGASGAGRTTAIRALEDAGGYEAIDNLPPLRMIERLLDATPPLDHPLALGIDVRNRDFSVEGGVLQVIDNLSADPRCEVELLYLDCSREVLIRRYSETRRRHPLAPPSESPADGILRELELLAPPVRAQASVLIDTSDLSVHDLKDEVLRWIGQPGGAEMLAVSVQSFSYKRGMARGLDLVFDARFLRNPHWEPSLRALDGARPRLPPMWPRMRGSMSFSTGCMAWWNSCCRLWRRGQEPPVDRLWLHRWQAPLGRAGGKAGKCACTGRLAGVN